MAHDLDKFVKKALTNVGPDNPLRKLGENEKRLLIAIFVFYAHDETDRTDNQLEKLSSLAADARSLAGRIKSGLFDGRIADALTLSLPPQSLRRWRLLPRMLTEFSEGMGWLLNESVGKAGHKGKIMRNQWLVMASEFVHQKTGKHYDEHLAEFLQAVVGERRGLEEDVSGDSIRKKREHLRKVYPKSYAWIQKIVGEFSSRHVR